MSKLPVQAATRDSVIGHIRQTMERMGIFSPLSIFPPSYKIHNEPTLTHLLVEHGSGNPLDLRLTWENDLLSGLSVKQGQEIIPLVTTDPQKTLDQQLREVGETARMNRLYNQLCRQAVSYLPTPTPEA